MNYYAWMVISFINYLLLLLFISNELLRMEWQSVWVTTVHEAFCMIYYKINIKGS